MAEPMEILLVEDDPRDVRLTMRELQAERLNTKVELCRDGAEALAVLRRERPDLVISDILMPTMDGYELLRQLRADPAISQTPVIFYTAHYHEKESLALRRRRSPGFPVLQRALP